MVERLAAAALGVERERQIVTGLMIARVGRELLLELGQPAEALAAFEASLQGSPNRFRSYLGAARAAKALERTDAARQWYAKLQELSATADTIRPEMAEAKAFVEAAAAAGRQ